MIWLLLAVLSPGCVEKSSCGDPEEIAIEGDWTVGDTYLDDLRVHIEGDTLELRYLSDGVEQIVTYQIGERGSAR